MRMYRKGTTLPFVDRVADPEHLQIGDQEAAGLGPQVRVREPAEDVIADQAQQEHPDAGGEGHDDVEPGRNGHGQGGDDDRRQEQQDRAVDVEPVDAVLGGIELPVAVDQGQEHQGQRRQDGRDDDGGGRELPVVGIVEEGAEEDRRDERPRPPSR